MIVIAFKCHLPILLELKYKNNNNGYRFLPKNIFLFSILL